MDKVSREQFKELRRRGHSASDIRSMQERGRVSEELNRKTFRQKGLLRAAGEFLNMDEFGRGIAMAGRQITGATRRNQDALVRQQQDNTSQLIDAIRRGRAEGRDVSNLIAQLRVETPETDFQELADGGVNNREVLGSAASTALNIASLGGAFNLGGKAATGAATVSQAARAGAAQGATSGALFGAAEATTEGTGAGTGALKGAAFGATVGGVLGGVSKYIDDLTKVTPESRLHETKDAFKTLQRRFKDGAVYQGKGAERKLVSDPITTLTNSGASSQLRVVDGKINAEGAREGLRTLITEIDDDVTDAIVSSPAKISLTELKDEAVALIKTSDDLKASGKVNKTLTSLNGYFDDYAQSYGDDLTMEQVSAIRRAMNKAYNPDTVDIERAIGDTTRKVIYSRVPGAKEGLAREGQLIAADKFLDALQGRAVKGGRMGAYFGNLVGAIAGQNATDTYLGSIAGAVTGGKVSKLVQSQQLNPIAPRVARGISSIVEQLPTDAAGNVSKTAVLNLIAQLSAQESSDQAAEQ